VQVSKNFLNFGTVKIGRSKVKSVALTNTAMKKGGETVTFNGGSISGSSEFTFSTNCNSPVGPKGKCFAIVDFAPFSRAAVSASVTINSNASNSPQTIGVIGIGK